MNLDVLAGQESKLRREAAAMVSELYRSTSYTILVVDDSETDRLAYRRYIDAYISTLGTTTCTMLEAESGEEGLNACQHSMPDLILLDYALPDLDGLEFLSELQAVVVKLPPVIMLTGQGNEQVAVEAMKSGVRDYLVKGDLTADSFTSAVQRVLSQQTLERLVSRQQRQQQLTASVALQVSRSTELTSTLQVAADGIRELLDCDRTAVYRFESDLSGTILAESVLPEWTACLGQQIEDTCFRSGNGLDKYLDGHKTVIPDIHQSKLTPCHIQMLERFEVKSNLVVPIVLNPIVLNKIAFNQTETQDKTVWGLLLAHHCRATRTWLDDELTLLDGLAVQLAIAIQQNEFVAALKSRAKELSAANVRLSTTAKLLKERNRELDEFAYIASHDLRAPLRAISNLATWIEEDIADQIPEDNQEQLRLIRSRAQRLDNFINGLLDYSRAGRESLKPESVNLAELIEEVVGALAPPETFVVTWPKDLPVINTYRLLLQQVLSNLIGNAIKYHDKEKGHIEIAVTGEKGKAQAEKLIFSITDDGPGIDPAYHQQIFGLFKTLNSRDDVESTGIGLSIVKKIVENQQGVLSLESSLGQGSTFTFTWSPQL